MQYVKNVNNRNLVSYRKKILYVLHEAEGGTPQTNNDLMINVNEYYDCYLLTSDSKTMKLSRLLGDQIHVLEEWDLNSEWRVEYCYMEDYYNVYSTIFYRYRFDLVHIRHLIKHTFDLPKVCAELNIPIVLSFHDFYFICPSYTLNDGKFDYCEGDCVKTNVDCPIFQADNFTNFENIKDFVYSWRYEVRKMFLKVNYFVTTSQVVKDVFLNIYSSLLYEKFLVIEHGRDFNKTNEQLFEIPSIDKPIKILILGNINIQKGSDIILKLNSLDVDSKIEFHFLGKTIPELKKIGIHHGAYERDKLISYIKKIKPSFTGIFSIWPETFCHTLTESWSCGIPVLGSNIGVIEDRILNNGGGWLIDIKDINDSYNMIINISENVDEYLIKQNEIKNIVFKSTKEMANEYLEIYNKLMSNELSW